MSTRYGGRDLNSAEFADRVREAIQTRRLLGERLVIQHKPGSNYSVTATGFTEVDPTNLAGRIFCSGKRPLRIDIKATLAKGTNLIILSVTMDGTEITGGVNGLMGSITTTAEWQTSWYVIDDPPPGEHRFALVAKVDAGTGTVFGTSDRISLSVKED